MPVGPVGLIYLGWHPELARQSLTYTDFPLGTHHEPMPHSSTSRTPKSRLESYMLYSETIYKHGLLISWPRLKKLYPSLARGGTEDQTQILEQRDMQVHGTMEYI